MYDYKEKKSLFNLLFYFNQEINDRQEYAWQRKVQIAERELHLRQIDVKHNPEKIIHPWKYLQNPSSILFYQYYKTSSNRINEINPIVVKSQLNTSLPKLNNKSTLSIAM